MTDKRRLVVGLTGATGAIYAVRLLEQLRAAGDVEIHLVISQPGARTLLEETDFTLRDVQALADTVYDNRDVHNYKAAERGVPLRASRILSIDPTTGRAETLFQGTLEQPFFTAPGVPTATAPWARSSMLISARPQA